MHAMQTRHLTHREDPKDASKLKDPEYSFRFWCPSGGEQVWVSSRTGKPAPPEQEGTMTLHPAMAWAHGLRQEPEDYPWAGERTDIRGVFTACSTVIIKDKLSTAPHFVEQILCTSKFPSPPAFDPVPVNTVMLVDGLIPQWGCSQRASREKCVSRCISQTRTYLLKYWEFLLWKAVTPYVSGSKKFPMVTSSFLTQWFSYNSLWLLFTFIFAS